MTPEKRLDQLEPLVAEVLAVLDQHSGLHRQTQAQVKQLTNAVLVQSDNIQFLLRQTEEIKTEQMAMREGLGAMQQEQIAMGEELSSLRHEHSALHQTVARLADTTESRLTDIGKSQSSLSKDVSEIRESQSSLSKDVSEIKENQSSLSQKVDLILQMLQGGNSRS